MSVRAQTEKNFRRSKVKPVKKRAGVKWAVWSVLRLVIPGVLLLYVSYLGVDFVASASTLQVRRISMQGNTRLSDGEVEALVDGLRGRSILTADLARYRARLRQSPWVADAALRRVLPSTIEIFISERQPIGLCRVGNEVYLLDRTGIIIDEFGPQYAEFDLPLIAGVVRRPPRADSTIDERRTALAASVIDALAPHKALAARLSQVDVSDIHDAVVLLDDDPALLHIGTERFVERLKFYLEIAPTMRSRVAEMDYVDLRFDRRAYVRPVGGKTLMEVPAGSQGTSGQRRQF